MGNSLKYEPTEYFLRPSDHLASEISEVDLEDDFDLISHIDHDNLLAASNIAGSSEVKRSRQSQFGNSVKRP